MRARDPTRTAVGRLHDNLEEKVVASKNTQWRAPLRSRILSVLIREGVISGSTFEEIRSELGIRDVPMWKFKKALSSLTRFKKRADLRERDGMLVLAIVVSGSEREAKSA